METPEKWSDVFLDRQRQLCDPLADEVVAQIVAQRGPDEARRLFDTLIHHLATPVDILPPVVAEYISATQRLPAWADPAQIEEAQALFLDHGPKFLIVLYYKSLPLLYSCAHGAEVLARTSRLTNRDATLRIFARRIAETGQFLIDVMTRGGLRPGGAGIAAIQKVRLIHAAIRHFLRRDGWAESRFGPPINQEDMAITLMTFSVALVDGLRQFGLDEPTDRLEAFAHAWIAIGHNLGLRSELLPGDLADGRRLLARILQRQSAPSEAGRLLTKALVDFAHHTLPSERLRDAPAALIRYFTGEERAHILGLDARFGCLGILLPHTLRALFHLGERLEEQAGEPVGALLDHLSRRSALAMVDYFNDFKGRRFHIPENMRRAWFTGS